MNYIKKNLNQFKKNKQMNPMLKTALIALVVVLIYDKFLKAQLDKIGGESSAV